MILTVGEILADVILDVENGEGKFRLGGAPFNASVGAARNGAKVVFYGRVGNDPLGGFLKRESEKYGVDCRIQTDACRPTTVALVSLKNNGDRDFAFLRRDSADAYVRLSEKEILKSNPSVLNIGSLFLSVPYGRKTVERLVSEAKKHNIKVAFDVNYRKDIFGKGKERFYETITPYADILKMSEDEVFLFGKNIDEVLEKSTNPLVCVTFGEKGCLLKYKNKVIEVKGERVTAIDSTGAGDAFFGALLAGIEKEGIDFDESVLTGIAKRANEEGAKATLHFGAI